MTTKAESRLQRAIRHAIETTYEDVFIFKVHGGPFQMAGVPDLIGCLNGVFFGLEVKQPGGKVSPIQSLRIDQIRAAGGVAEVVESMSDALEALERGIPKAIRFPTRGG